MLPRFCPVLIGKHEESGRCLFPPGALIRGECKGFPRFYQIMTINEINEKLEWLFVEIVHVGDELSKAELFSGRARAEYDIEKSRALLLSEGSNADKREAEVRDKLHKELLKTRIAEATVKAGRARQKSLSDALSALQSRSANFRDEQRLSGSIT